MQPFVCIVSSIKTIKVLKMMKQSFTSYKLIPSESAKAQMPKTSGLAVAQKKLLQCFKAHSLRLGTFFTQTLLLVRFVLLVVAVKEHPLAIAFSGQDVGGNAV